MRCAVLVVAFLAHFSAVPSADAQHAVLVSVDSFGVQGNDRSFGPLLSADGRYVAFVSLASNLVPLDTNGVADVFVRDTLLQTTRRVSVDPNGLQGNAQSGVFGATRDTYPLVSIAGDGRRVAFYSDATNFAPLAPFGQVYVRDLVLGTTELASASGAGTPADAGAVGPVLSADGNSVVFTSRAGNLVPGGSGFLHDIFVRDLVTQTTRRLVTASYFPGPYVEVNEPAISADGRFVAYRIYRIVGPNGTSDIEVLDRDADVDGILDEPGASTTIPITAAPPGGTRSHPALSGTGRFVTFRDAQSQVLRHDRDVDEDGVFDEPGATAVLTLPPVTLGRTLQGTFAAPVSNDGRFVAYLGTSPPPVPTLHEQLTVHDAQSGVSRVTSYDGSDGEPALGPPVSGTAAISADGAYVAYDTESSNLISGDTNGAGDVFLFATADPYCFGTTTYCIGAPNSVGLGALIGWTGSVSIAEDAFALRVVGCPPGTSGLFYYGGEQIQVPFGNGFQCVGAGAGGLYRLGVQTVGPTGHATRALLLHQPPLNAGPGAITPASAWNFQFWYRNPAGGGAGFNTSDALHAVFCP